MSLSCDTNNCGLSFAAHSNNWSKACGDQHSNATDFTCDIAPYNLFRWIFRSAHFIVCNSFVCFAFLSLKIPFILYWMFAHTCSNSEYYFCSMLVSIIMCFIGYGRRSAAFAFVWRVHVITQNLKLCRIFLVTKWKTNSWSILRKVHFERAFLIFHLILWLQKIRKSENLFVW